MRAKLKTARSSRKGTDMGVSSYMKSDAPALAVVRLLKSYGAIPKEFLARLMGRRPSELEETLKELEGRKVITTQNGLVDLNRSATSTTKHP